MDYDDAISLENTDQGYRLGIHIIDVGAYIKSGDPIDLAARERASSIYMPDDKLPMLPADLSDDLCSLRQGEIRPAISTLIQLSRFFEIQDVQIVPSIIQVHQQMSYTEANLLNGKDDPITTLHKIATLLREKRLKAGAVQNHAARSQCVAGRQRGYPLYQGRPGEPIPDAGVGDDDCCQLPDGQIFGRPSDSGGVPVPAAPQPAVVQGD